MEKKCENCEHYPIRSLADPRYRIYVYRHCWVAKPDDVCPLWAERKEDAKTN